MAIVVLLLWVFTAGAGFSVLITSNLKRDHAVTEVLLPASVASAAPSAQTAQTAQTVQTAPGPAAPPREPKPSRDDRFAPASLVAARNAPVMPGPRALLEFAHPALGIVGLGFWLGFSLIHYRVLGWVGFGLAVATAAVGLFWFSLNARAARHRNPDESAPMFRSRLVATHGSGAALTVILAALSAVVLH